MKLTISWQKLEKSIRIQSDTHYGLNCWLMVLCAISHCTVVYDTIFTVLDKSTGNINSEVESQYA